MTYKQGIKELTLKHSIIIVDDEKLIAELVAENLFDLGIKSVIFSNPIEAANSIVANNRTYGLVITDYHMPELTGLEMIRKVHQKISIPYVLMSGQLSKITDNYNINEIARLQKPFKTDELLQLISEYFHNSIKQSVGL